MTYERYKMLCKEVIELVPTGEMSITKEEEIRGLKDLVDCLRKVENFTEEKLKEIYETELEKINKKYENAQEK